MSKITDTLTELQKPKPPTCSFCTVLANLAPGDRKAIGEALDTGVESAIIGRALRANGYTVNDQAVRRHRKLGH